MHMQQSLTMHSLYDHKTKEIYRILGQYGIKEPKQNMVIELCNLVIDEIEQAYEAGFTKANNDWAFKVDKTIVDKLKSTEVKNDYRIINANTDIPYGEPEK